MYSLKTLELGLAGGPQLISWLWNSDVSSAKLKLALLISGPFVAVVFAPMLLFVTLRSARVAWRFLGYAVGRWVVILGAVVVTGADIYQAAGDFVAARASVGSLANGLKMGSDVSQGVYDGLSFYLLLSVGYAAIRLERGWPDYTFTHFFHDVTLHQFISTPEEAYPWDRLMAEPETPPPAR